MILGDYSRYGFMGCREEWGTVLLQSRFTLTPFFLSFVTDAQKYGQLMHKSFILKTLYVYLLSCFVVSLGSLLSIVAVNVV